MSRKLLSLLVAVAFVLMTVSTSFAAIPTDVAGTDFVKSVGKMQNLGIMVGDPSGNFRPNDTIKRSEFAKIAVVALGLSDAAAISAGATKFSDVAADNWASGFVNIAAAQGVIAGYPDGTFKPEQTITYAEAITIIVRMLGYKPVLDGKPYPGAYVAKASDVGVTKDVVLSPTVGASRGNVAKLMGNAVDCNMLYIKSYDDQGKPVYTDGTDNQQANVKTLLTEKLNTAKLQSPNAGIQYDEYVVSATPVLQTGNTAGASLFTNDHNPVTTQTESLEFASTMNADDYLGLKIKAWKSTSGSNKNKIVVAEITTDPADIYDGIVERDSATKIKLVGLNKVVELKAGDFWINSSASNNLTFPNALGNDKATGRVVLSDGKAAKAYVTVAKPVVNTANYKQYSFTVKEIRDGYVRVCGGVVGDKKIQDVKDDISTKSKRYEITKNGVAATIDDIKAGDAVTRIINGSFEKWIATSNEVKGTVASISDSGATIKLKIGDKDYSVSSAYVWSFNSGDDYDKFIANAKDIVGKEVTINLNAGGQIARLVSAAGAKTYYYGIVRNFSQDVGANLDTAVTLYKADGTKVSYVFEKVGDFTTFHSGVGGNAVIKGAGLATSTNFTRGDMVQYQLTSDNKIKELTFTLASNVKSDTIYAGITPTATATPANNSITVGGGTYLVKSDTVIFSVYELMDSAGDVSVIPFGTIDGKGHGYQVLQADNVFAKYVKVDSRYRAGYNWGTWGSDNLANATSGIVTALGVDADGPTATVNAAGTLKTYKLTGAAASDAKIAKGNYIAYNVNSSGKIATVSSIWNAGTANVSQFAYESPYVFRIMEIDTASKVIKLKRLLQDGTNTETGSALAFKYADTSDLNVYFVTDKDKIEGGKTIADLAQYDYVFADLQANQIGTLGSDGKPITITRLVKITDQVKAFADL